MEPVRWIGGIYPAHNEDRILRAPVSTPPYLVEALIADRRPRTISSISAYFAQGIIRAMYGQCRGRRLVVQGAGTLTAVGEEFLSEPSERSLWLGNGH